MALGTPLSAGDYLSGGLASASGGSSGASGISPSNGYRGAGADFSGQPVDPNTVPGSSAQQSMQFFQNQADPTMNNYNMAQNQNLINQQMQGFSYDSGVNYLNQNYQDASGLLGLQQANNQIDLNSMPRQMDYYTQMGQMQNQNAQQNAGSIDQLWGLNNQQYGVQGQQFQQANAFNQYQAGQAQRAAMADATSRGAGAGSGTQQDYSDIGNTLSNQLAGNQSQYALQGIQNQQNQTQLSREKTNILYSNDLQQLSNSEQQARLKDRQSVLENTSKQYGLQADQLANQLQNGLNQLGVSHSMSLGQLLDGFASNDAQKYALSRSVAQQALMYQSYFPGSQSSGQDVTKYGMN